MIFAGAGILLSVAIILDFSRLERSDIGSMQAAKDVIASQDALVTIFEQIEIFFRRLEEYAEVPMTDTMKGIMVKIMVEVLEIFAIMTKEIKQGRASESIPYDPFPFADRDSERHLKKYFKKSIERKGIEAALSRLDRLTRDEVNMATVQILEVSHHIDGRVNQLIEGTFATSVLSVKYCYSGTISDPSPLFVDLAMFKTSPTALISYSTELHANFEASLKVYEKKTEESLLIHPLMAQLQGCSYPPDILVVLRSHVPQFEQTTSADGKLTNWLDPIVNVLSASSSVISAVVGVVSPIQITSYDSTSDCISRYSHLQMSFSLVPVFSFRWLSSWVTVFGQI